MAGFSSLLPTLNISAVYMFIGNGAKLQYANMDTVKTVLAPAMESLDKKHGAGVQAVHDQFIDIVYKYQEEKDDQGRTLYGGVKDRKLVGGTKVYMGEEFRKVLSGIVNIDARGRVGTQELEYARQVGVQIHLVEPAEPSNTY